jgi:hypothetical protein
MRRAAAAAFMMILCLALHAKDFPESILAVDPLRASDKTGMAAGMGASLEYGNFTFAHDVWDLFYFRVEASPVIVNIRDIVAVGGRYESILFSGPVLPSEKAASIMEFTINAVQFEYGLYGALDLGPVGLHGAHLLAEYARTSQHPFRSQFSQVSADILKAGISFAPIEYGRFRASPAFRAGFHDLFDFWNSPLPKPRTEWILMSMLELDLRIADGTDITARFYPELFRDRLAGSIDGVVHLESGLSLVRGAERLELLFTLYATGDSEMLKQTAHPALEMGLALRMSRFRN